MPSRTHAGVLGALGQVCSGSFAAAVSNFSIQYNYACASIASAVMLSHRDRIGEGITPDYPEPDWAKHYLLGAVFFGSVAGMLSMGYLGDVFGLKRATVFTNALVVVGALSSALVSWGSSDAVWGTILASRFLLGVGVGGNYPLGAAKAAETTHDVNRAVAKAAQAFFWQGPGSCSPYVLALVLLQLPHVSDVTSWQYRILLGFGSIPALLVVHNVAQDVDLYESKLGANSALKDAFINSEHKCNLVGTAGTWFLFDVAYYGTTMFLPDLLEQIFGKGSSLTDIAVHALFVCVLGVAGTAIGLLVLDRLGAKALNTIGLSLSAAMFATFLIVSIVLPDYHMTLFSLISILLLVLNLGPSIATYVLPVLVFPPDVRSTFHGLSAAAAKFGAMCGALLFPVVDDLFGTKVVMACQASICIAGVLVNVFCVSEITKAGSDQNLNVDEIELAGNAERSTTA